MVKGSAESSKEGGLEKGSRYLRNFNLAVGIGALAVGAAIGNSLVTTYGIFNMAQAGFFWNDQALESKNQSHI